MPKRNYKAEIHSAIMKKAQELELTAGNAEEIREAQARFFCGALSLSGRIETGCS